jgi:hypothetical protein
MSHRLSGFLLALGALAAGLPLVANTPPSQATQTTKTETVKFAPGGTIRLKDSFGTLTVEGWDRPEVEVTVVKSLGFVSEPEQRANQRLDGVHVVTERKSDTELEISTTAPSLGFLGHLWLKGHDVAVEYLIRAPRNSHLVINHAGYISVAGMTGDIEATDRRGDIVLMLPDLAAYSIDAHTKAGLVTSDIAATTRKKHLVGENLSHSDATVPHKLVLRMGFGGITIKELPPEAATPK